MRVAMDQRRTFAVVALVVAVICATIAAAEARAVAEVPPGWTMIDFGRYGPIPDGGLLLGEGGHVVLTITDASGAQLQRWAPDSGTVVVASLRPDSYPTAINRGGDVTGYAALPPFGATRRGFRWTPTAGLEWLTEADAPSTVPHAINDAGVVVGDQGITADTLLPFRVDERGLELLPLPEGFIAGSALDINNSGIIVGTATDSSGRRHAVLWRGAEAQLIDPVTGGEHGATDVNDQGTVLGWSRSSSGAEQPFLRFASERTVSIDTGGTTAHGLELNEQDEALVSTEGAGSSPAAYLYSADEGLQAVAAPSTFSAVDLGADGLVVGRLSGSNGSRAVAWTAAAGAVELGGLPGGMHSFPARVNAAGQITGFAVDADGRLHAVLWSSPPLGMSPATPIDVVASLTNGVAVLSWRPAGTNALGYDVIRARWDPASMTWAEWTTLVSAGTETSFTDPDTRAGYYAYLVRAYNLNGKSLWATRLLWRSTDSTPPAAPTQVAVSVSGTEAVVTWQDNADNELGFDILRGTWFHGHRSWGNWTVIQAPVDAGSIQDTLLHDARYVYLVRARNPAGASEWTSTTVDHTASTAPPTAPTDLLATWFYGVHLNWTDTAAHEQGYEILRARWDPTTEEWAQWTVLGANADAVSHSDGLAREGLNAYAIRAYNTNGASEWVVTTVDVRLDPTDYSFPIFPA